MKPSKEANSNSVYLDRPFGESAVASQSNDSVPDTIAKIDKAMAVVVGLSAGSKRWIMSIPANVENDPDLVIADALATARRILEAGMQPPNNQPNSDHVAVIGAKPDSDHLAVTSAEPESRVVELRVWWIPQVPGKAFYAPAESVKEASNMLAMLASYDQFQLDNNIKPDYCNAGGLEVFEDGEWTDWYSEDGETIDEFIQAAQSGISSPSHQPNEKESLYPCGYHQCEGCNICSGGQEGK